MADGFQRRADGRENNQLRPLATEQGLLHRCDGSARFCQGNTSVLAAVFGPAPPKFSRLENPEKATIDVTFKPSKGTSGPGETEFEILLRSTMEACVALAHYPRTVIQLNVQVLFADGSVLATALLASTLALVNAGIDMVHLPLPVHVAIPRKIATQVATGPDSGQGQQGVQPVGMELEEDDDKVLRVRLDPTLEEEQQALANLVLVTTNTSDDILTSHSMGTFTVQDFFACAEIAVRASQALLSFIRASLHQKCSEEMQTLR
mmetsp:Transcript_23218/g.33751  ORF Transcript_23218/g.33751 Transcript_23218/m.33751 type:complete len:263 (-) Transcript_23218:92-880(-)|eukprot:CAMPEP_0113943144 /NCGR_PEP_ID=MMETSP1339-20121228/19212_1 /TAXON_ID=94617 /ORGANISM="Fibrocapsa japonica" /LENGTH=262 /DNA_ID=CAMNT_0000947933 /DNA_START=27 /DNA_END=815 /DNA_ORIENTATION=+ /assembly_acc=CAM_ASM_000762